MKWQVKVGQQPQVGAEGNRRRVKSPHVEVRAYYDDLHLVDLCYWNGGSVNEHSSVPI